MHIYFSGIGGTAISGLALIARQAGYDVSGSDAAPSPYIQYLKKAGITDVHIGQTTDGIKAVHRAKPIDWFLHSSALGGDNPELVYCQEQGIRTTKRDEFLNEILSEKELKLVAIAGTHGKTTTTAMAVWLFKQLNIPVSYQLGGKIGFGELAVLDPASEYFVYECDEFDRNFLAFNPDISIISGLAWDHHEIFSTKEEYLEAFNQFISQSQQTICWQEDYKLLNQSSNLNVRVEDYHDSEIDKIKLTGLYNRRDAWLVVRALAQITGKTPSELVPLINGFPGVSRRFEKIIDNLYTDYAHTPEKIIGALNTAREVAKPSQKIVVIYEPLTNRRMHYTLSQHIGLFEGVDALYWVPSFLAREDPAQAVLGPAELIKGLDVETKAIAKPMNLNNDLVERIKNHLEAGDLVLALSGGGSDSLDDWLRNEFLQ